MCVWVCVCLCLCITCVLTLKKPEEGFRFPGTTVTVVSYHMKARNRTQVF